MKSWQRTLICCLLSALIFVSYQVRLLAQTNSDGASEARC